MSSAILPYFTPYLSVEQSIIYPMSALLGMYFAYGIYVLLFGTYIYMIRNQNQTGDSKHYKNLYNILTVVLFVLSTIFVVNDTAYYVHGTIIRFNVVKGEDYSLFERYQDFGDLGRRFGG
ncbi:hypothetical protein VNI00_003479 [Paramarasmius palmivorus]|uniref:Uncharacterized protein n=1 Tax=Paramarasmius palmivorus TaxID=297713 RepID=A0AAW0DTH4_9AGAR